jgi:hypothetical protein
MLLPPDLRDWVQHDGLILLIADAVDTLNLSAFRVNHRSTGSLQFPPGMLLALLIYCYANQPHHEERELKPRKLLLVAIRAGSSIPSELAGDYRCWSATASPARLASPHHTSW